MKVLNDWPDKDAMAILQCCAVAARPNGRVVVMGGVARDETPRGLVIEMVRVGGTSRGMERFTALANQAGLSVVASGPLRNGRFAVELRPRSS